MTVPLQVWLAYAKWHREGGGAGPSAGLTILGRGRKVRSALAATNSVHHHWSKAGCRGARGGGGGGEGLGTPWEQGRMGMGMADSICYMAGRGAAL